MDTHRCISYVGMLITHEVIQTIVRSEIYNVHLDVKQVYEND